MGRAFDRAFDLDKDFGEAERLQNTIARRDAIIHPTAEQYPDFRLADARDALSSVLRYVESVRQRLAPYLVGYLVMLQHHTDFLAKFGATASAPLRFQHLVTPTDIINALSREWFDAHTMFDIANLHDVEADSDGSMLTRAAMVLLYSMLNAHLSFMGCLALNLNRAAFTEKETNYFNEVDFEMTSAGVSIVPQRQPLEDRATIVPSLIAKKLCSTNLNFPRGDKWFQDAFKKYFEMRNRVMHSKFGEYQPRVSKQELRDAFESIRAYFEHVSTAGGILGIYGSLLQTPLRDLKCSRVIRMVL